ncbi:uncharacterized protein LOC5571129 isoform X1 [Aedes aegypti]|uniref:Uncharacterized protein n=1 Tax=Aedes aegypti TaxID=7159 RepID=A0A903UG96_AEDAE|nr:uncharacterized protein LOC5571129 isoform X1 [Aedes aegypti]
MLNFVNNFLIFLHNLNVFYCALMNNINGSFQTMSSTAQEWIQWFIDKVTPTTRRTKSFDDNAWKSQRDDESLNLSSNISAVSSVALSSARHDRQRSNVDPDPGPSICGNAVSCGGGLDDILVIESSESDSHSQPYSHCGTLSRGEVRKSRSKMKSYLKRCKEALIGSQTSTEDTCPITHHEAVVQHQQEPATIQIPTANWYLDDQLCEIRPEDNREPYSTFASARLKEQLLENEEQARQKLQQLGHENETTPPEPNRVQSQDDDPLDSVNESDAAGGPVAQGSEARPLIQPSPPPVGNSNLSSNGIEKLVDLHFGPLYPDYADHTRPVLIRQARDLLVCTFHGDLERFEAGFLRPAASIVGELKSSYLQGQVSQLLWVSV